MLEFPQNGDERGHLVIVEGMQDIPFNIARIFYIYGSEGGVVRGQHANRRSQFVLINVAGSCKVKVKDGRGNEAVFVLNRPHTGIYLPPCSGRTCTTSARTRCCSALPASTMTRRNTSVTMKST